jgi:hypothetical protein
MEFFKFYVMKSRREESQKDTVRANMDIVKHIRIYNGRYKNKITGQKEGGRK